MLPATIICEPISECFVASLIIGWAAHHVFRWDIMVFFMCHCLAWFIFDYIQLRGVQVCGQALKGGHYLVKLKLFNLKKVEENLSEPFFSLPLKVNTDLNIPFLSGMWTQNLT